KHRQFIHDNIVCDVNDACAFYGAPSQVSNSDEVAGTHRDAAMLTFDRLLEHLDDSSSVREFFAPIVAAVEAGFALWQARSDRELHPDDVSVIVAADTAFQLHRYVVEILSRVLKSFAPQSALALQCAR
ncbi:MAG: hypothetical protein AAFY60_09225, partial [Myxococcota bacterium]